MIPFDFEYHKPASLREAVLLFQTLQSRGREPVYYCGGTEFITLARLGLIRAGAVIDVKGIAECGLHKVTPDGLVIGAAVTLNALEDSDLFPLMGKAAGQIADRTARNKITAGGNICGEIFYREAVLPLLLTDAEVVLAGPSGLRTASIHTAFDRRLWLHPGEMLVQARVRKAYTGLPFFHLKRRRMGNVGYPVVTVAALKMDGQVRVALSGVCTFPFRSRGLEALLNDRSLPPALRVERAPELLPAPVLEDPEASAEYREHVLKRLLADALQALEGVDG